MSHIRLRMASLALPFLALLPGPAFAQTVPVSPSLNPIIAPGPFGGGALTPVAPAPV